MNDERAFHEGCADIESFDMFQDERSSVEERFEKRRKEISELSVAEQAKCAFQRIMRIASKREISSAKMKNKLKACGYCDEAIELALEEAYSISAIDDIRYCECLIRTTLSSGRGLSKVEREIRDLGISLEDLESYQEYLEVGESDRIDIALEILYRRPPRSKNIYASAYRKLISKGYPNNIASAAAKEYCKNIT